MVGSSEVEDCETWSRTAHPVLAQPTEAHFTYEPQRLWLLQTLIRIIDNKKLHLNVKWLWWTHPEEAPQTTTQQKHNISLIIRISATNLPAQLLLVRGAGYGLSQTALGFPPGLSTLSTGPQASTPLEPKFQSRCQERPQAAHQALWSSPGTRRA